MSTLHIAQFIKEYYPQYYSIESYPANQCVLIHKITEQWGILSNFAQTPFVINGVTFDTSERLYQSMRFSNPAICAAVFEKKGNPKMTAKHYSKEGYQREDWGRMIVDAMKFCLSKKYEQSAAFRQALEDSKGLYIVEDQTSFPGKNANTWGAKREGDTFVGPNLLGRLLMELRDNCKLEYVLPPDALDFLDYLKG
jgi:ribA/ribD-fused uncharacterized protein